MSAVVLHALLKRFVSVFFGSSLPFSSVMMIDCRKKVYHFMRGREELINLTTITHLDRKRNFIIRFIDSELHTRDLEDNIP